MPIDDRPDLVDPTAPARPITSFDRLIDTESGGVHTNPDGTLLTSPRGAKGITQIMPKTGVDPGYGVKPLQDDSKAEYLRFGRDYRDAMLGEFGGDEEKAAAAYNAGPGAVKDAVRKGGEKWKQYLPEETKNYVAKVAGVPSAEAKPYRGSDTGEESAVGKNRTPGFTPFTPEMPAQAAPEEDSGILSGTWADLKSGTAGLGAGVGRGLQLAGRAFGSPATEELGTSAMDYWTEARDKIRQSMPLAQQDALNNPILNDDFTLAPGSILPKIYHQAMEMAPAMIATGAVGKVAIAGLAKGAEFVGASTRLAGIMEKAGIPADAALSTATKAVHLATVGTGVGVPQGLIFGLQAGAEAENAVNRMPFEQLNNSPAFQQAFAALDPSIPLEQRLQTARSQVARIMGDQATIDTGAIFGGFGILAGGGIFGKLGSEGFTGGVVRRALKGAGLESATLGAQMAGSTVASNLSTQKYLNPQQPTFAGVPNALAGAAGFAIPFGGIGGAFHPRALAPRPEPGERAPGSPSTEPTAPETGAVPPESGPPPGAPPLAEGDIGRAKDNAPFATKNAAVFAVDKKGLAESHEPVQVEGGWVLRPIVAPEDRAPTQSESDLSRMHQNARAEDQSLREWPAGKPEAPTEPEGPPSAAKAELTDQEVQAKLAGAVGMQEGDIGRKADGAPFANKLAAGKALAAQKTPHEIVKLGEGQYVVRPKFENEVDQEAHAAATSPENEKPEPTQPQKEAGNYEKGHVSIGGLDVTIENPKGSVRKSKPGAAKPWETTMQDHYGYIKRTEGADGEHVDAYIKEGTPADYKGPVFVVDQKNPATGKFDEHKVMLGYDGMMEASKAYTRNYSKEWKGAGATTQTTMDGFKAWLKEGDTKKPFAEQNVLTDQQKVDRARSEQRQAAEDKMVAALPDDVKGRRPNKVGVYEPTETLTLPDTRKNWKGSPTAEIHLSELADGTWREGSSAWIGQGGFGYAPSGDGESFKSRADALAYAIAAQRKHAAGKQETAAGIAQAKRVNDWLDKIAGEPTSVAAEKAPTSAKVEQAAALDAESLKGLKISLPVHVEETGETVMVEHDAREALTEARSKIATLKRLLECVGA